MFKGATPGRCDKVARSDFDLHFINLNSVDLGCVLCGTYCLVWQTEGMTAKEKWRGGG